ncbi:MAG: GNAT family N-acetyltransferase [Bacteroidota bacterium]
MEIQHVNNTKNGVFFIEDDGQRLAEMTYVWSGDNKFIIDHTQVSDLLKGKGIGKQLVMAAVAFARQNRYKIMPLCPFAKRVFDSTPGINEVLF